MTTVSEEMVERAHKALMSELFLICQPDRGDVFSFMDDHPEVLRAALSAEGELRDALKKIAELHEVKYGSEDYGWEPVYSQKDMFEIAQAALAGRTAG
jgi:hypothetical protein